MKKTFIYSLFLGLLFVMTGCNDSYVKEQYFQKVSFKTPTSTVTRIRLKYRKDSASVYRLPLIVSGTTKTTKDIHAHVGLDIDTLAIYNQEHFYDRHDLYFQQLEDKFYDIPSTEVCIPAGKSTGLMDIHFNFKGLDLSEKWVLPLKVLDSPDYDYQSNTRKNCNNALLWITPFNDYSGSYGVTTLSVYLDGNANPIVEDKREGYVVDENTIFFYAGAIKENRPDRRRFKLYATFQPMDDKSGTIKLVSDNPDIQLKVAGQPTYEIQEMADTYKPYLIRRSLTIRDLDYTFVDPWENPNHVANYHVKGSMTLQRNINTTIPDEEYAIEWE